MGAEPHRYMACWKPSHWGLRVSTMYHTGIAKTQHLSGLSQQGRFILLLYLSNTRLVLPTYRSHSGRPAEVLDSKASTGVLPCCSSPLLAERHVRFPSERVCDRERRRCVGCCRQREKVSVVWRETPLEALFFLFFAQRLQVSSRWTCPRGPWNLR